MYMKCLFLLVYYVVIEHKVVLVLGIFVCIRVVGVYLVFVEHRLAKSIV